MKKLNFLIEVLSIGIIVFLINTFLFQICFVQGDSMNPTLKNGQVLLAKKFDYTIKTNDIVVINKDGKKIIKRIVGIPNDEIEIKHGYVYVNDNKFDNNYTENPGNTNNKIKLKNNEYYVLGDNRQYSIDSRFDEIGLINEKEIIGIIL